MVPRFRFAPSPTGSPHIGNLHTALFSWALARGLGGDFILRIDDTDEARNTAAAVAEMIEALQWLGLDWDEGPDAGGEFGPYRQSERLPLYQQAIEALTAAGHAYAHEGAIRLKMPEEGEIVVEDALRGRISFPASQYTDPILVRSSGQPLYHLATVVDDHLMEISHVVRGEEWISTTPIHMQLYAALGWQPPIWVHLPLILNRKGKKLSKRDEEGGYLVSDLQAAGYLPEAVFNYLILLGWSPEGETEIINRAAVVRQMRLERLSASPAIFDWDKLNWLNRHYISQLSDAALEEQIRPYLDEYYGPLPNSERWLVALAHLLRGELTTLADAADLAEWAFAADIAPNEAGHAALVSEAARPVLLQLMAELAHIVLLDTETADSILRGLRTHFRETFGWSAADVLHPIRAALTGTTQGPALPELMSLLGKQRCLERAAAILRAG